MPTLDTSHWGLLRHLSWRLYLAECEWLQNGIYLVLGYKDGDNLPRWSPARITLLLADMLDKPMRIGKLRKS